MDPRDINNNYMVNFVYLFTPILQVYSKEQGL